MNKIIDTIIGSIDEKKAYMANEKRAMSLPKEYSDAYKEIKNYIFHTSGIVTMQPLVSLTDLLEEAAANGKHVTEVTGPDVAAFADELVKGEKSYYDDQRKKLNKNIADQAKKNK